MIEIQKVDGFTRSEKPSIKDTIINDEGNNLLDVNFKLAYISVYIRPKIHCPFNRGNWLIDFHDVEGNVFFCLRLPIEMTYAEIKRYVYPVLESSVAICNTDDFSIHL